MYQYVLNLIIFILGILIYPLFAQTFLSICLKIVNSMFLLYLIIEFTKFHLFGLSIPDKTTHKQQNSVEGNVKNNRNISIYLIQNICCLTRVHTHIALTFSSQKVQYLFALRFIILPRTKRGFCVQTGAIKQYFGPCVSVVPLCDLQMFCPMQNVKTTYIKVLINICESRKDGKTVVCFSEVINFHLC